MSQRVPLIALVGRPNVGKSTLFNRLLGRRAAIVDDQPGVTRDRLFGETVISGRLVRLVDTGGIETGAVSSLMQGVREQTQLAIDEADLVVHVLDAEEGPTPADAEVTRMLRKAGKPAIAAANKTDIPSHDTRVMALYELGVDPIIPISAEHGRGLEELVREIIVRTDPPEAESRAHLEGPINVEEQAAADDPEVAPEPTRIEWQGGPIRVAVVGRPNVGKSSMINRLLGEERHLASNVPGTTRDSIDSELTADDQVYVFTDTAGIRRKRNVEERLEKFAVMMSMRALDGADVAIVVIDAGEPISDQDARIAAMAIERGKGLIVAVNKWDLVSTEQSKDFNDKLELGLGFATSFAPVMRVSAKTGRGLHQLLEKVVEVQRERHRRVATGELNRFFRDVVADSPPPMYKGHRPKLFFVSQPLVRPPTFIFTASHTAEIRDSYMRYLSNALRKRYGFSGTPIWIKFRGKK